MMIDHDDRHDIPFLTFGLRYVLLITIAVALALALWKAAGLQPERALLGVCGVLFLLAAIDRPHWLSVTVRSTGWFAAIPNQALRWLLAVFGLCFLLAALFASFSPARL